MHLDDVPCQLDLMGNTLSCRHCSKAMIIWAGSILERIMHNRLQRLIYKKTSNNMKMKMINNKHKCNNNKTKCKSNKKCKWWMIKIRTILMKKIMMPSPISNRRISHQRSRMITPWLQMIIWVRKLRAVKCRLAICSKKLTRNKKIPRKVRQPSHSPSHFHRTNNDHRKKTEMRIRKSKRSNRNNKLNKIRIKRPLLSKIRSRRRQWSSNRWISKSQRMMLNNNSNRLKRKTTTPMTWNTKPSSLSSNRRVWKESQISSRIRSKIRSRI